MAKGRVSDEELEEGLASAGGLGGFVSASKVRRDSPFGVEHVRAVRREPPAEPKHSNVKAIEPAAKVEQEVKPPQAKRPVRAKPEPKKLIEVAVPEREALAGANSEKVSLPMPVELRDAISDLAKKLQRMRTEKTERITSNTVMRVAIQVFIERFDADKAPISNTEAELLEAVRTQLKWK